MPNHNGQSRYNVAEIKDHIKKLSSMSALAPEEYCEEGGMAHSLVQAKGFGKDDLKVTQLHKVFSELQKIHRNVKREVRAPDGASKPFDRQQILPLLPVLAYASGRKLIPFDFYDLMRMSLSAEKLQTNEDFLRLYDFFRAIIAYHKYHHSS